MSFYCANMEEKPNMEGYIQRDATARTAAIKIANTAPVNKNKK